VTNILVLEKRYLITTFKAVPRGTEGAVSMEGTIAGLLASILLASVGYLMREVMYICFHMLQFRVDCTSENVDC